MNESEPPAARHENGRGPLKDRNDPMRHLRFPVAATRMGMVAEQVVRAFWPFWTAVFLILAPLMMGWQDVLPLEVIWGGAVVAGTRVCRNLGLGHPAFPHALCGRGAEPC